VWEKEVDEELQHGFARTTDCRAPTRAARRGVGAAVLKSPNAAWSVTGGGSSGPVRRSCLEGHDETVRGWIAAQNDLTLSQLQERLQQELQIRLSITALWHRLQRLGLSFKTPHAADRERPDIAAACVSGATNVPRGKEAA